MRLSPLLVTCAALATTACKSPVEAPTELNELAGYLWVSWSDSEALAAGLENLDTWMATQALDSSNWADRSWTIDPLAAADVEGLTNHGLDPANAPAVSLARLSEHSAQDHTAIMVLQDQTVVEPASPNQYDRTFTSGKDCFPSRGCATAASVNQVNRDTLLIYVDYSLDKEWQWVDLPTSGGEAIVSRSWIRDEGVTDDEDKYVKQIYFLELYLPNASGSLRYQVSWSEQELGVDADTAESFVVGSMDDTLEEHDKWLSGS